MTECTHDEADEADDLLGQMETLCAGRPRDEALAALAMMVASAAIMDAMDAKDPRDGDILNTLVGRFVRAVIEVFELRMGIRKP